MGSYSLMFKNNFRITKVLLPFVAAFWATVFSQSIFETEYDKQALTVSVSISSLIFYIFIIEFSFFIGNLCYDYKNKKYSIVTMIRDYFKSERFARFKYGYFTLMIVLFILYIFAKSIQS